MTASQNMHIGIVLPSVPGYSETFFRSKIAGLQQNGIRVTLFVKNPKGAKDFICPVKVHPLLAKNAGLRLLQTIGLFLRLIIVAPKPTQNLLKIARSQGYTLMQAVRAAVIGSAILPEKLDWLHFGFATAAIEREMVGAAIGAKVAVSFRGYDISVYPVKHKNCYALLWRYLDQVHTISDDLLEVAYRQGLPRQIPVYKITPAIKAEDFICQRNQLLKSEPLKILSVARLHWKKGLEYTLEALVILKNKGIEFRYKIAGDGDELERLTFAVHQLDLVNEVEFLGKVNHDEVKKLMRESEIYIQYSVQEGFCNSVLEAQASGMLCIVSDAEGLQENVLKGQTGWVVPKRSPNALAQKLSEVIQLPEIVKKKTRQMARERVEREFGLQKQQEAFINFYACQYQERP